ncbi:hypothetical protein L495_5113 [Bordetella bronchiseptica CARE970018BB]|nr:hypothetical protein AZ15_5192 [Bordetella bronchiseptica A1-7]KDB69886.1 hypothetical protein AZ21_5237 [Bordetella bronchiseptica B20-10725633]KDB80960.1 hypothetical protein L495_5113 [Bordetella bronchiseptica CARE970018BB]KDC48718.1 hypothetical protein L509_5061 [Bordetella bronchiseptica M85/00/2]KDC81856.1 hypothetical protein L516_4955 [Bordetella bronchiseptica MBORD668]KDC83552.1 hypothetical protein L515_4969 [Bordetella bronchiseptica MBORD665]KDC96525.1 hypothetical protein L
MAPVHNRAELGINPQKYPQIFRSGILLEYVSIRARKLGISL